MKLEKRKKLFENPTGEYRGKPFWSWNGKLEEEELKRQIDVMKEMGFGGYFMHSRTGLETEYLGGEWFRLINTCADYGQKEGMESWLYDEDRWPSGSAGGIVTKEEKYRAMFLEMNLLDEKQWENYQEDSGTAAIFACILKDGIFSAKRTLHMGEELLEGENVLEFRIRYAKCSDNYNGYTYLDTMNQEAVEKYLASTHEKYKKHCGERLGTTIKGIFTDEPHRGPVFSTFSDGAENAVPYTPGMFEEFERRFGYSLKENLPELFLRKEEGELSKVTRDYFELCQELFLERFALPVYRWCQENHLIFTGHVLHEDALCCQAVMQGSLMRFYEYMEYPGIDLLGEDNTCYWVAKQIQSVARQLDKKWVLSELYGCTGWQMNFESYKNIGDWQALFGVNLRCPHLSWYTMKGEAKRDYPASILHQSSWYKEYHYLENYFSRIHVALQEGKTEGSLLVINPIESVWARAYSGAFQALWAKDKEIQRLEEQYEQVFHALTDHRIDFDYGEEDILGRHGRVENGIFYVGQAAYRKILVAGMETLRSSTVKLLREFADQGGEIIFAGEIPGYVDVERTEEVKRLAESCICVPWEEEAVVRACGNGKEIQVESLGSSRIFAQSLAVEEGRMVMLLNTDRKQAYTNTRIGLGKGSYVEQWDARTGKIFAPEFEKNGEDIFVTTDLEAGGERIYLIRETDGEIAEEEKWMGTRKVELEDSFSYTLSEKNICVLDMVTVKQEGRKEISNREVLKADRALREQYQIPYRGGEMLQPWYQVKYKGGNTDILGTPMLEYTVEAADIPVNVELVVEELEHIRKLQVNGIEVPAKTVGKWMDICFDRIKIPDGLLKVGKNKICIDMDYYKTSGIEAMYLLGDFGVELKKERPVLTKLPEKLWVGDLTSQGLSFYSGSVTYHLESVRKGKAQVTVKEFGGALVKLLGKKDEIIAFPPYQAVVEDLRGIEVVLTRRNTFGPLHELPKKAGSYGPYNFLTEGDHWSEEYVLYEQGLLGEVRMKG